MTETNICFFGQDASFPCNLCAATSDICADPSKNQFYNPMPTTP
jgi:hypothetical protein